MILKQHYKDESIVITDPCFVVKMKDVPKVFKFDDTTDGLKALGFKNVICSDVIENDCYYKVYSIDDNDEIIGDFELTSQLMGVFSLEEIEAYNPDGYDIATDVDWGLAAVIHNFTGNVEVLKTNGKTVIRGKGNINFYAEPASKDVE